MASSDKRAWMVVSMCLTALSVGVAHGQSPARLTSTRLVGPAGSPADSQFVIAGAYAEVNNMMLQQRVVHSPANTSNSDANLAQCSNAASASAGNLSASSNTLVSARCSDPVGASTYTPLVDTTANATGNCAGTEGTSIARWQVRAQAQGTFQVDPTTLSSPYLLQSSLYLVANGGGNGENVFAVTMVATAANSSVTAQAFGPNSGWSISGLLANANGPPTMINESRPGLNNLYVGNQSTMPGDVHILLGEIRAGPQGSMANGQIGGN
jgi:hypothetical protein